MLNPQNLARLRKISRILKARFLLLLQRVQVIQIGLFHFKTFLIALGLAGSNAASAMLYLNITPVDSAVE